MATRSSQHGCLASVRPRSIASSKSTKTKRCCGAAREASFVCANYANYQIATHCGRERRRVAAQFSSQIQTRFKLLNPSDLSIPRVVQNVWNSFKKKEMVCR